MIEGLRTRLRFAVLISIAVAPFNILRFCVLYFFKYYTEFTKNPSKASARTFTPFAEWKIREFNELDHLFNIRYVMHDVPSARSTTPSEALMCGCRA